MKILNATWFTEMGKPKSIGIVIMETEGEEQSYIGTSNGFDEERDDAVWIAKRGARFPLEAARVLMPLNTLKFDE